MNYGGMLSLPTRECGLKSHYHTLLHHIYRHSLRGSVDWNWKAASAVSLLAVTPYAGVWIEIRKMSKMVRTGSGHSLRGSVDWNYWVWWGVPWNKVTPYAGVWIEIGMDASARVNAASLPTRECGLKFYAILMLRSAPASLPTRECGLKLTSTWIYKILV